MFPVGEFKIVIHSKTNNISNTKLIYLGRIPKIFSSFFLRFFREIERLTFFEPKNQFEIFLLQAAWPHIVSPLSFLRFNRNACIYIQLLLSLKGMFFIDTETKASKRC